MRHAVLKGVNETTNVEQVEHAIPQQVNASSSCVTSRLALGVVGRE